MPDQSTSHGQGFYEQQDVQDVSTPLGHGSHTDGACAWRNRYARAGHAGVIHSAGSPVQDVSTPLGHGSLEIQDASIPLSQGSPVQDARVPLGQGSPVRDASVPLGQGSLEMIDASDPLGQGSRVQDASVPLDQGSPEMHDATTSLGHGSLEMPNASTSRAKVVEAGPLTEYEMKDELREMGVFETFDSMDVGDFTPVLTPHGWATRAQRRNEAKAPRMTPHGLMTRVEIREKYGMNFFETDAELDEEIQIENAARNRYKFKCDAESPACSEAGSSQAASPQPSISPLRASRSRSTSR
jgi:hypothetical protein